MRKIIVGAQVSMDGVMQAPGGAVGGSDQGLQVRRLGDALFRSRCSAKRSTASSRRSAISCSAARPMRSSRHTGPTTTKPPPHGGIAKLFKDIKKYVVSRSGDVDTSWQGSVLLRDIADVKRLREEDGPNLVTQGSTELVHALLANDLVDAISIFTVPVVLGGGKKLFADGSAPHSYKLTRSRVSTTGLMIAHYERAGEIKIGDTAVDSPSDAERARRERMKREG